MRCVRVTHTPDIATTEEQTRAFASVDETVAFVSWLADFLSR
jgi:hypothetical protein